MLLNKSKVTLIMWTAVVQSVNIIQVMTLMSQRHSVRLKVEDVDSSNPATDSKELIKTKK